MKSKIITYGRQSIDKRDIEAVVSVLKSPYLTQGPKVKKFEKELAKKVNAKYAVVLANGTAALHAACFAAGVDKDDEVITTPFTFAASANCVLYRQGKVVFADTYADVPLIDPNKILKSISVKTKAIIPVDYAGLPVNYDQIKKIAKKHKLVIIADASHSLGAFYKGQPVGSLVDMTVFSFHPVKSITTGEGGAVVTDNEKYYQKLKLFRTHGITKNVKKTVPWYYEMQELGFNYRLTDMQAALGLSQLSKLEKFIKLRTKMALRYIKLFSNIQEIEHLPVNDERLSAWHLFPIFLSKRLIKNKLAIVKMLYRQGIHVQVHYIPVHLHPFYRQNFGYKKGDYPYSESFYAREISLPLYSGLTLEDQDFVVRTVKQAIIRYSDS